MAVMAPVFQVRGLRIEYVPERGVACVARTREHRELAVYLAREEDSVPVVRKECVLELVECDETGYIIAGEEGITSCPGFFAAGDIRTKSLRQVVTAVADGASCVKAAERWLQRKG